MAKKDKQYTAQDFYDSVYDGVAEESAGGGVIGRMKVEFGYKVFPIGLTGEDVFKTFFPIIVPTKDGRAKVREKARAFAVENGEENPRPRHAAGLTMYKAPHTVTLSGEDVEWNFNQLKVVPLWTIDKGPSAAKLFMDAVTEHKVPINEDFYGRVTWRPDPYQESLGEAGKTEKDQEGNLRVPLIAIIAETFPDKSSMQAAAEAYAANAPGDNGTGSYPWADFPGDWGDENTEGWTKLAKDFEIIALEDDLNATKYADEEFGEDLTWLIRVCSLAGFGVGQIANLTGEKKKVVKAAIAAD